MARRKPEPVTRPDPPETPGAKPSREFLNRNAPVVPACSRCEAKHADDFGAFVRWSIAELVAGRYQLMCSCGRYRFAAELTKGGT